MVQRGLDAPTELGDHFREDFELELTAATDVVVRVVLDLSPVRALSTDIDAALDGSPDEEIRRACNDLIPEHREVMEWLRTNDEWATDDFRSGLERIGGEDSSSAGRGTLTSAR